MTTSIFPEAGVPRSLFSAEDFVGWSGPGSATIYGEGWFEKFQALKEGEGCAVAGGSGVVRAVPEGLQYEFSNAKEVCVPGKFKSVGEYQAWREKNFAGDVLALRSGGTNPMIAVGILGVMGISAAIVVGAIIKARKE